MTTTRNKIHEERERATSSPDISMWVHTKSSKAFEGITQRGVVSRILRSGRRRSSLGQGNDVACRTSAIGMRILFLVQGTDLLHLEDPDNFYRLLSIRGFDFPWKAGWLPESRAASLPGSVTKRLQSLQLRSPAWISSDSPTISFEVDRKGGEYRPCKLARIYD